MTGTLDERGEVAGTSGKTPLTATPPALRKDAGPPRSLSVSISTGVLDIRGVRHVRLSHIVEWLQDVELDPNLGGRDAAEVVGLIRTQLEQAGEP